MKLIFRFQLLSANHWLTAFIVWLFQIFYQRDEKKIHANRAFGLSSKRLIAVGFFLLYLDWGEARSERDFIYSVVYLAKSIIKNKWTQLERSDDLSWPFNHDWKMNTKENVNIVSFKEIKKLLYFWKYQNLEISIQLRARQNQHCVYGYEHNLQRCTEQKWCKYVFFWYLSNECQHVFWAERSNYRFKSNYFMKFPRISTRFDEKKKKIQTQLYYFGTFSSIIYHIDQTDSVHAALKYAGFHLYTRWIGI